MVSPLLCTEQLIRPEGDKVVTKKAWRQKRSPRPTPNG
jgi:hypothetical protein